MKKRIGLLLGVLLLIGATGCEKEPQKQDMTGAYNVYEGYLTHAYQNTYKLSFYQN